MNNKLKIAFAGTPEIAKTVLEKILAHGFNVDLVLTKPDSMAGRGKHLTPSVVKNLALQHNIPVLTPESLRKDTNAIEQIRAVAPDIMIVVAYGLILPQEVLDIPRLGCVNIHVSLLPKHRGAAPIQRAVLEGDKTSGITIIQMDRGLDTGDILLQTEVILDKKETSKSLHDRLSILGADMIIEYLQDYSKITGQKQSEIGVTYAHKLEKPEARIDWNREAIIIDRQIRAFNPFPGAFCEFNDEIIKIWGADLLENEISGKEPGTITKVSKETIEVQAKNGVIAIKELQLPGKKRISVKEYLNGLGPNIILGQKYS